jgi:Na+/phosphate symporter
MILRNALEKIGDIMARELIFEKEKETKNTVRFQEKQTEGNPPIIGTLYVQKWFVGNSNTVKITIEKE